MEPAATSPASAWRRTVRRRSLGGGDGVRAAEERGPAGLFRRVEELEAAVLLLRAEKEAAERAAVSLRAELEAEQRAAEAGASEVMLMIERLQLEKSAAMIEAREFRRVAETRAARVRELQCRLAEAYALAASYLALLRAHGIDPGDGAESSTSDRRREERATEYVEDGDNSRCGDTKGKGVLIEKPAPSPAPAPAEEFVDKYAVDVRWAAVTAKAVAGERVADNAGDLRARVEALEADSAAVRREVTALREERAQEVQEREAARRLRRDAAAKQSFSVLAVFKWFFSTMLWGMGRSASAVRKLPSVMSSPSTACILLGLLPLLERSKGTLKIQGKTIRSKTSSQPHGLEYMTICYFFQ